MGVQFELPPNRLSVSSTCEYLALGSPLKLWDKICPVLVTCRGQAGECIKLGEAVYVHLGNLGGIPSSGEPVDSCSGNGSL